MMNNTIPDVSTVLRHFARNKEAKLLFKNNPWFYNTLLKPAKRYIAGEELNEAIEKAVILQNAGYGISLEYMGGEDTNDAELCNASTQEFLRLIRESAPIINKPNICFDLSNIGLTVSYDMTLNNLSRIAAAAKQHQCDVIISMEEYNKVDSILNIYKAVCQEFDNVGITIQAYLFRTLADLQDIARLPGKIRLVKGVYKEDEEISLNRSDKLNQRYFDCLDLLCKHDKEVILGTHDNAIISHLLDKQYMMNEKLVIEMLHGACVSQLKALLEKNIAVNVCLAYGKEWFLHLLHRLAEYPPNIYQAIIDFHKPENITNDYYF